MKLGTLEMRMRNRICKCFYILSKEQARILDKELASLELELGSPFRASRVNKTKENPYFIWADVQKLQDSYNDYGVILKEIMSRGEEKNLPSVVDKSKLYQHLIEELVQMLLEIIQGLCISLATHFPRLFPKDFTPRKQQLPELLLEADRPQQQGTEVLEAEKSDHKLQEETQEVLLEAERSQPKVPQVPWQKVLPKAELPPQEVAETRLEVLSEADFPQEAKTIILIEADQHQQDVPEVPEVLEAERPQHRVEQALLEADRPRLETVEVSLELHQPQEEVPQPEVPPEAEQPQQEVPWPEALLEADRPQQQGTEVLEAEKSEQKVQGETQEVLLDAERPQQQVVEVLEAKRPQHKGPQVLHEVGKPQNDKRTELPEA